MTTHRVQRAAESVGEASSVREAVSASAMSRVGTESPRTAQAPSSATARAPKANWRAILSGASPREVLARTMAGDPLALRPRVAGALERACVVLDADRVFLRTAARVARFAPRYRGQPDLNAWLDRQVSDAIEDLLEQDADDAGTPRADASGLRELAAPLGLDEHAVHAACAALNALELADRRAFRALVLEGRSLDELARETGSSATEIARAARRALEAVLAVARGGTR